MHESAFANLSVRREVHNMCPGEMLRLELSRGNSLQLPVSSSQSQLQLELPWVTLGTGNWQLGTGNWEPQTEEYLLRNSFILSLRLALSDDM